MVAILLLNVDGTGMSRQRDEVNIFRVGEEGFSIFIVICVIFSEKFSWLANRVFRFEG